MNIDKRNIILIALILLIIPIRLLWDYSRERSYNEAEIKLEETSTYPEVNVENFPIIYNNVVNVIFESERFIISFRLPVFLTALKEKGENVHNLLEQFEKKAEFANGVYSVHIDKDDYLDYPCSDKCRAIFNLLGRGQYGIYDKQEKKWCLSVYGTCGIKIKEWGFVLGPTTGAGGREVLFPDETLFFRTMDWIS